MIYCVENDSTVSDMHIGENTVHINTEADVNDITEYPHDDKPSTGMFVICYAILSTLISLCLTCSMFTLFCY